MSLQVIPFDQFANLAVLLVVILEHHSEIAALLGITKQGRRQKSSSCLFIFHQFYHDKLFN